MQRASGWIPCSDDRLCGLDAELLLRCFSGKGLISTFRSVSGRKVLTRAILHSQRVQSTYMVQSMVSVVVIFLMVGVSIPHV